MIGKENLMGSIKFCMCELAAMGAPICNIVLQHFYCNMADAFKTIPQETLFGSLLVVVFG